MVCTMTGTRNLTVALATACLAFLPTASAVAGLTPEVRCEALKNNEAGKYAFCLQKAEAKLVKTKGGCSVTNSITCYRDEECPMSETCNKDTTKYEAAVTKCETKLSDKWTKLEQQAVDKGATCPDGTSTESQYKNVIDEHAANIATGLAAGGLEDYPTDLMTCNANLSTCNADLGTCNTNYSGCQGSLNTCTSGTATPADVLNGRTFSSSSGLGLTGTAAAGANVNGADGLKTFTIPDGLYSGSKTATANDANLVGGNIVSGTTIFGVAGTQPPSQPLRTGQGHEYGSASDGALEYGVARSYTDNGDGTITDNRTGLMWEKKSDDGSIHDKDTTYTWGETTSPYTMDGGIVTIFLAALNGGGGFAGHTDWRIPNRFELETIVNLQNSVPAVDASFDTGCVTGCSVTTCSCTQSDDYWSSTTQNLNPFNAWFVSFNTGVVNAGGKNNGVYVRAVRGGS